MANPKGYVARGATGLGHILVSAPYCESFYEPSLLPIMLEGCEMRDLVVILRDYHKEKWLHPTVRMVARGEDNWNLLLRPSYD